MKIGLYGVSRSGKNYLIDKMAERTKDIQYISGSTTLKELALLHFHSEFRDLTDSQKTFCRFEFTKRVVEEEKNGRHIIVDGHYSFPKIGYRSYDIVFTEADKSLYDIFIYLNTPSDRIVANANLGGTDRENTLYDIVTIDDWKTFEMTELRKVCRELNKELIVFDGVIESCCDFLCDLVSGSEYLLASNIVNRIITDNQTAINDCNTVLLIDCDRTITLNDTTYDFCKAAGIDKKILKEIYYGEYYSVYQFYRANKQYDAVVPDSRFYESCRYAASKAIFNDSLLTDVLTHEKSVCTIGITSGIANVWSEIISKLKFPQILIGKGRGKMNGYFVSTTTKYTLAEALKRMGKKVIAIGDSMIDIQMLETADSGFIVTGEKINAGVQDYFETVGKNTQIRQLIYNPHKYNNILAVASIWE
jgi:hypothetical protein